jgi:hypothetical protein
MTINIIFSTSNEKLIDALKEIGRKNKMIKKYGGQDMVVFTRVVEYLIDTHPEVKKYKVGED